MPAGVHEEAPLVTDHGRVGALERDLPRCRRELEEHTAGRAVALRGERAGGTRHREDQQQRAAQRILMTASWGTPTVALPPPCGPRKTSSKPAAVEGWVVMT